MKKTLHLLVKKIFFIALGINIIVAPVTGAQAPYIDFFSRNDILFYTLEDIACQPVSSVNDTSVVANLPQETIDYLTERNVKQLAEDNMERYAYAEEQTSVPWQAIAALHYREAGMASNRSIFNGALLGSGVNVDGQVVVTDPNDDAQRAANHFIGLAKNVYDIDITKGSLGIEEWGSAFLAYNRGALYKKSGNTYLDSPYVMNGYDAEHMDMNWVGGAADPGSSTRGGGKDGNKAGALAVMEYLGGVALTSGGSACPTDIGGGLGISAEGFTFPLKTTQTAIQNGSTNGQGKAVWCYTSETNCHGSYTAADIHVKTGTAVVAAVAGEVTLVSGSVSGTNGLDVSIHGEDGVTYYYTHLGTHGAISVGQTVPAGYILGTVGTSFQAQGTAPHLHFDAGEGYTTRPACSRANGCPIRDQLIDTQPILVQAYQKLPE